jgi:FkbM family methyltransferase
LRILLWARELFSHIPILRFSTYRQLTQINHYHSIARWTKIKRGGGGLELRDFVLRNIGVSTSQLQQDIVALYIANSRNRNEQPFFVEIGAGDGYHFSNTFILEKYFGWDGLLVEPSKKNLNLLRSMRTSGIDTRGIYTTNSSRAIFNEARIGEHSSLDGFSRGQGTLQKEEIQDSYEIETCTLNELLTERDVPTFVDFLSIDTEGSEYEILKNFKFDTYTFGFICIEVSSHAPEIEAILQKNGYKRILGDYSRWDSWFAPEKSELFTK